MNKSKINRHKLAKAYWHKGAHPNPTMWHETAEILRENKARKPKSQGGNVQLDAIQQLLKERK